MSSFAGPAEAKGSFESLRKVLHPILIVIFMVLPWVRVNNAPILLFDIFNRQFIIFGFTFYSHEAPLLFFFLILVGLTIFIITALFGRLWCGWACPQTVFLHSVFNQIERLVLGPYSERKIFYNSSDSWGKKFKILLLNIIYLIVSWILAHSFVAYFLGSSLVTQYIYDGPFLHMTAFIVLSIMSFVLFFNFTIFRENLCFYVCPYGRFQNALIDNNSYTVFYDAVRGEPRARFSKNIGENGDCVACNRCVDVCPTKIDIRKGFQMECIACGICIDACNTVMTRFGRNKHLIRYETGDQKKINFARFRLILYSVLFVIFSFAFVWSLSKRTEVDLSITRSHQMPFSSRIEAGVRVYQNQFQLHIKNQKNIEANLTLALSPENQTQGFKFLSPAAQITLNSEQDIKVPAFIEIDENLLNKVNSSSSHVELEILIQTKNETLKKKFEFVRSY